MSVDALAEGAGGEGEAAADIHRFEFPVIAAKVIPFGVTAKPSARPSPAFCASTSPQMCCRVAREKETVGNCVAWLCIRLFERI